MTTPETSTSPPQRNGARRARGSLSSTSILDAAMALAEETSVEDLSMPKLARRLDVGVTSLYWYFRSKDDLLESMVGQAATRYLDLLPDHDELPWDERVRVYFRDMRDIYHDNPVLCDFLVFRRAVTGRPRARFFERINREVTRLIDAGFDPESAARGYMAMSVYTQGCVHKRRQQEMTAGLPGERFITSEARAAAALDGADLAMVFPGLDATIDYWSASFATDDDFAAGLDLIIDGLRARLRAAG
jgi:AcrR family transcriptional regulator